MSMAYDLARFALEFITTIRSGDIEWQRKKLEEISELKKQKRISDLQIDHEIDQLKIRFGEEINRTKEKETRITKDYKDFLGSLDEMKQKMLETFTDMPKPMVYIIHQHGKGLIDDMWRNSDEHVQALGKAKFADFLIAVYDDSSQVLLEGEKRKIPTKTLKIVRGIEGKD